MNTHQRIDAADAKAFSVDAQLLSAADGNAYDIRANAVEAGVDVARKGI